MATATENPDSKMTTETKAEKQSTMAVDSSESEIEEGEDDFDPAVVYRIRTRHGDNENLEQLGQVYDLARWGGSSTNRMLLQDSSFLKGFRDPMDNTALHLAALHGNDEMVDLVAKQCPDLQFSVNYNDDTPLHVAARAGHLSTLIKVLEACANNSNMARLSELMEMENREGNTMLHEAMMCRGGSMASKVFHYLEACTTLDKSGRSLSETCYELALNALNRKKESVLCLAVKASITETVSLILEKCPKGATPRGISPLVAAIMNRDKDMLTTIVSKKQEWMHLEDEYGRLPLHCAASIGYQEGVVYLLGKCKHCTLQKDADGLFPLHLAARGGHVKVLEELLGYCLDPDVMLDEEYHRNILHIAVESGKLDVVRYILQSQDPALEKMINQMDKNGDTPLHVAASMRRTKIVYALTGDGRVVLNVVNKENQTAFDIAAAMCRQNPLSIRATHISRALRTAGAKRSPRKARRSSKTAPDKSQDEAEEMNENWLSSGRRSSKTAPDKRQDEAEEMSGKRLSSAVESLTVISTLIVTASAAACFSVPGEAEGTAHNLHKAMFSFFIFCITISFFSSISATILLLFARLNQDTEIGDIEWKSCTTKLAVKLIGAALITLSLAFVGGVYTVISKLTWLAITFVVMSVILVVIVCGLCLFLYGVYIEFVTDE